MAHIKDSPEQHEVVVIGSGAGGGTVAHVLTGLGIRVTLLEAGPMVDPLADFKEHVWPHEVDHRGAEEGGGVYFGRGEAFGHFNASAVRGGWTLEGEPYTVAKGSDFLWFRSRIVGGRTNHYGRISLRFSDYDFHPYGRDGLGTNWPISYEDLAPITTRPRPSSESQGPGRESAAPLTAFFSRPRLPRPMNGSSRRPARSWVYPASPCGEP